MAETWLPVHGPAWLMKRAKPFRGREALVSAPAIALILGVGLALDRPIEAAAAAGAAFSVGFGAHRAFAGTRWAAMVGAALGMTAAAFAGSLLGNSLIAFLAAAGVIAGLVAWLALHDENVWWISLQCAIAFFVSGAYAGSPHDAMLRAAVVAMGGAVQIGSVVLLRALILERADVPMSAPPRRPSLLQSHVARAAISVIVVSFIVGRLGLANGYWAPITALLVLKPGLRDTHARGMARLSGTVGGCAAASIFEVLTPGAVFLLVPAVLVTAWLSYALLKAHYALFTAAVTATVVLVVATGRVPEITAAEHRIAATLIGGGIALIVAYLGRRRPLTWPRSAGDRIGG